MGHDCQVPAATGQKKVKWKCPDCRKTWTFRPDLGPTALGTRSNRRMRDGSKPTSWWNA